MRKGSISDRIVPSSIPSQRRVGVVGKLLKLGFAVVEKFWNVIALEDVDTERALIGVEELRYNARIVAFHIFRKGPRAW